MIVNRLNQKTMKLNTTERFALLQILKNENNQNIRLEKGAFHGSPVLRIHYSNGSWECVKTVSQIEHAEKLGWKKCNDAPFPSDTWHNADHPDCQDGRTITLEEMLEVIQD